MPRLVQVSSFIIKKMVITIAIEDRAVSILRGSYHPHPFAHLKRQVHKIIIKKPAICVEKDKVSLLYISSGV